MVGKSSSNRSPAKENSQNSPSTGVKPHSVEQCRWDKSWLWSPSSTFDPDSILIREGRICASLAFNLWDSVRAGRGVLWEGRSRNLLCLFWWADRSLAARCSLSSLWPTNSGRRTSPRLQRRGPRQHVGCSVERSKGRAAAEHVHRCQEIAPLNFLWLSAVCSKRFEETASWK